MLIELYSCKLQIGVKHLRRLLTLVPVFPHHTRTWESSVTYPRVRYGPDLLALSPETTVNRSVRLQHAVDVMLAQTLYFRPKYKVF